MKLILGFGFDKSSSLVSTCQELVVNNNIVHRKARCLDFSFLLVGFCVKTTAAVRKYGLQIQNKMTSLCVYIIP